jgi:hypothetical protein
VVQELGDAGSTDLDLWIEDGAGKTVAVGIAKAPIPFSNLPNGRTGKLRRPSTMISTNTTRGGVSDGH